MVVLAFNEDGHRDRAKGIQNVGASVGQTALNVSACARTRWAAIFSGGWMLIFVVALAPVIERLPMAVLGALMVFAGAASIKPKDVLSVFRTGWMPIVGFMTTQVVPLVASVPLAVVTGVALAIVLNMVRASNYVTAWWKPAVGSTSREGP